MNDTTLSFVTVRHNYFQRMSVEPSVRVSLPDSQLIDHGSLTHDTSLVALAPPTFNWCYQFLNAHKQARVQLGCICRMTVSCGSDDKCFHGVG